MSETAVDVFFYGLFMDPEALRGKGLDPQNPRPASVMGMALEIGERATLVPRDGATAYGMVIALTEAELARLYSEPGVAAYRPQMVMVQIEHGRTAPARCYNLPPDLAGGVPNPAYADKLRALAQKLQLPESYIRDIR